MKKIFIDTEMITLGKFLKLAEIIHSGGEAKWFLLENNVSINDAPEHRRGRKVYNTDKIIINNSDYYIVQKKGI